MLGRAREASLVESLIGDARGGVSGSLLVSGEPGIGKTVLLAHARGAGEGALILEATGAEGESHLPFAGLADLLRPVLGHLDELPEPQAAALRGALALGPPVPGDRFTTYAGTLSLLAAAADRGAVVCIIDDAHWLDAESVEAVQFVARRLGAEGIAILLGARDGISERIDASPLPRLRLGRLNAADSVALLTRHSVVEPAPAVAQALDAGAGGNPLALIELAESLTPGQLTGADPLPDPLPVGPYLQEALLRPVRALPEPTRRALVVMSADDGSTEFLISALATNGLAMADLEPAERAGIVALGPARALFSHPLVRAAVYQSTDAAERRAAHRAHARSAAMVGEGALDRRAWHQALAATGPDEQVAAELEEAAGRAAARNAYAATSTALEAAARLSPSAEAASRRLVAAGQSAMAAGDFTRAGGLFDEVIGLEADPALVVEAIAGRGHVETFGGSARRAVEILVTAADRVERAAPAAAAGLLVQATIPSVMRTDLGQGVAMTERAQDLARGGPAPMAALTEVAAAVVATYSGHPREPSPEAMELLAANMAGGDPVSAVWFQATFQGLMLMERYDEAVIGVDAVIQAARARSTPSVLLLPLFTRAELHRRTGRLDLALADAAEAVRLGHDLGQQTATAPSVSVIALIDGIRGRSAECRSHVQELRALAARAELDFALVLADGALGLLELGSGELEEALRHLRSADRRRHGGGGFHHPLVDNYEQDLAETLIRLGQHDEADDVLSSLDRMARSSGTLWPTAAVARCRGLMAGDDFEPHFAAALSLLERTTVPFELARTQLCLGERRRRARRARDAREPLTAALATFEALGAAPWADWARRELRAAGARPRGPRSPSSEALTPQELQVAVAVAEGATNKEAATALLISPKTVEYHLGKVYEKLGVRSRAELAGRIAREGVSPSGTEATKD